MIVCNIFVILHIIPNFVSAIMAKERKVVHVEIINANENYANKHYYFGSMACIYELFSSEDIGITYSSLRNIKVTTEPILYRNKKCIIRIGSLQQKSTHRGYQQAMNKDISKNISRN